MNSQNITNVFLSYCHKNNIIANSIYDYFMMNRNLELRRDIIDIKPWGSIKEYMQSICYADYVILLISDEYLKSVNCMYEVLEVMRNKNYRNKIFPVVIDLEIYKPISRAGYVKYWENEFYNLKAVLDEINVQNIGKLNKDLKLCQEISSNIAEFLEVISDMNNPQVSDVVFRIEEVLIFNGIIKREV